MYNGLGPITHREDAEEEEEEEGRISLPIRDSPLLQNRSTYLSFIR